MMTLKIALIAMMIGSSTTPLPKADINKTVVCPQVSMVASSAISNQMLAKDITPVEQAMPQINKDKTYEQCMREAFERIYEEVNRMLDKLVDSREEQF